MLPRLIFLQNYQTEGGDRYRVGLTYQVTDVALRDLLVADRIAYVEGTDPPFDSATTEKMIEEATKEEKFQAWIAKRRKNSLARRQEVIQKQEEQLQKVVEARVNRNKEGAE